MSFKDELLQALEEEFDISPKTIAGNIAQVVKGETVKEKYVRNKNGSMELAERTVSSSPSDVIKGAMIYDAITGGTLGIAPKTLTGATSGDVTPTVHKRLAVDRRIIANSEEAKALVVDEETTLSEVIEVIDEA